MKKTEAARVRSTAAELWVGISTLVVALLLAGVLIAAAFIHPIGIQSWLDRVSNRGSSGISTTQILSIQRKVLLVGGSIFCLALIAALRFQAVVRYAKQSCLTLVADGKNFSRRAAVALRKIPRGGWGLVALLTILGAALRLHYLHQPMRTDESSTYLYFASKPLVVGIANYAAPNNHLFHTLLCHFSISIFGNQPWAIRLPALLAGIALIPLTFLAAAAWYSCGAAVIAAALVASCSFLIEFSTNARGYTLQAALILVMAMCGTACVRKANWFAAILTGVLAALSFWTIPTTLYAFCALCLWWAIAAFIRRRDDGERQVIWVQWGTMILVTISLAAVLYSPVFVTRGISAVTANSYVVPLSTHEFISGFPRMLVSTSKLWVRGAAGAVLPVLAVLAGIGLCLPLTAPRTIGLPVIILLTALSLLTLQRVLPFDRVWIFLIPFCSIAVGAGTARLCRLLPNGIFAAVGVFLLLATAMSFGEIKHSWVTHSEETGLMPDGPATAEFLNACLHPNDHVVMAATLDIPLEYYLKARGGLITPFDPVTAKTPNDTFYLIARPPVATLQMATRMLQDESPHAPLPTPAAIATFGQSTVYTVTGWPPRPLPHGH